MVDKDVKGLFERVYDVVRGIPEGKVMTYGQVAKVLDLRDVRKVGFALHANPYPPSHKASHSAKASRDKSEGQVEGEVPCHRVVNKEGRLAPNFAFDGPGEQRRRLEAEGVEFKDEMHVDLERCGVVSGGRALK